jgi:glycosyltransferase involved in cell wall biosynthesis
VTRITVVVPVKDDAPMLEHCLASLKRQIRPADQLIVVDNGSSDDSAQVAARFGATVVTEPRVGIWQAAATGFDAATGDIIARCDADSRPDPDWLERIEEALSEHPSAVAVSGPGRFYDLGQPLRFLADLLYMRAYFLFGRGALANRTVFGSNLALRATAWRDVAEQVHRDDPDVHDDFDLAYHFHPAATVLYDRTLTVGISARPFRDRRAMVVRYRRGLHTVAVHGARDCAPMRWRRRIIERSQS